MSELKSGSNLEKVLKAGHFAFTGECGPPKGANVDHLKEKFQYLKGNVDAVNVTDNQTAVVRMASLAASKLMVDEGYSNKKVMEISGASESAVSRWKRQYMNEKNFEVLRLKGEIKELKKTLNTMKKSLASKDKKSLNIYIFEFDRLKKQ